LATSSSSRFTTMRTGEAVTAPAQPSTSAVSDLASASRFISFGNTSFSSTTSQDVILDSSVGCLSMAMTTISTMTFSWCAHVAESHTIDLSATMQPSVIIHQGQLSRLPSLGDGSTSILPAISMTLLPSPTSGAYAFGSQLPALQSSTLMTLVGRSPSIEDRNPANMARSDCGGPSDKGDFMLNVCP
jgi:hypothetical protein